MSRMMKPTDYQNQCWFFLLFLLLPIQGFTQRTIPLLSSLQRQQKGRSFVISNNNNQNKIETTTGTTVSTISGLTILSPTTRIIRLEQHKPLGCTVEESLADPLKVFITKIIPGSFADQAELQVGDVIDGVSGFFGTVTATIGLDQVYVHQNCDLVQGKTVDSHTPFYTCRRV
jgi:PDZ domain